MTCIGANAFLLLSLSLTACKTQSPAPTKASTQPTTPPEPANTGGLPATSTSGTLSGTIALTGKAPTPVLIDTSMDPACSLSGASFTSEQYVGEKGALANVFVFIKSGPLAAMQAPIPATAAIVLDQKNCRYLPHVIALPRGGTVEVRNSDPTMHNIHTEQLGDGNQTLDVSQGPGAPPQRKQFPQPEIMLPVRCNNHPWMNAFLNVSQTPFFAVSDTHGHFTLHGLPPGDYTLAAVHEKLGEQDLQVTIKPQTSTPATLTFTAPR